MESRVAKRMIVAGLVIYTAMWGCFVAAAFTLGKAAFAPHPADAAGGETNIPDVFDVFDLIDVGRLLGLLGFALIVIGALLVHRRARWMYYWGAAAAVSYLIVFPFGTILGICGIVFFVRFSDSIDEGKTPPQLP